MFSIAVIGVAIALGLYSVMSAKPVAVESLESLVGPLLFRGSPSESVFTDQYIQIQWHTDIPFLGEPRVSLKFYASRNPSDSAVAAEPNAIRIKGTHEEFLISKYFMGINLVYSRA